MLGYSARQAVPLNLAVSLVTIVFSLFIRSQTLTIEWREQFYRYKLSLVFSVV